MSGSASLDLERLMLGHTLAIAPMATLSRVYVALCRTAPTEAAGGEEVTGAGYARPAATFTLLAVPANAAANATAVDFAPATGDWGTVTHFEIWTQATGGTRLYWGQLVDPADSVPIEIEVTAGNVLRFSPGTLVVQATDMDPVVIEDAGPFLPTAGGTMTGPLLYAATGGIALRPAQDRAAERANVLDFGAVADTGFDSTTAFRAAIATGKTVFVPAGVYRITDILTLNLRQTIYGDGRGLTRILVYSATFNMSALGVIQLQTGGEPAGEIHDLSIEFNQTNATSRATLNQYPPAIYAQGAGRFRIYNVMITNAMTGLDARGNCGGSYIDRFEVGAFNYGMRWDGSLDGVHIDNYHFWPFAIGTLGPVFSDGNSTAAEFGKIDSCSITNFVSFTGKVLFNNPGGAGTPGWYEITNMSMDGGFATVQVDAANWLHITNFYKTGSGDPLSPPTFLVNGGVVRVTQFEINHGTIAAPIQVTGGELYLDNGSVRKGANKNGMATVSGGRLRVDGMTCVDGATGALGNALFVQTGTGILQVVNSAYAGTCTSGEAFNFANDNPQHAVSGFSYGPLTITVPAEVKANGPAMARYQYPLRGLTTSANAFNTAYGANALAAGIVGATTNSAFGDNAGFAITTGNSNTLMGHGAGQSITTGTLNTAVGRLALSGVTTLAGNTALGFGAMQSSTGASNTAVGRAAGAGITSGNFNTVIGHQVGSGVNLGTGQGNILIGVNNTLDTVSANVSHTFRLGGTGGATFYAQGLDTVTPAWTFLGTVNTATHNVSATLAVNSATIRAGTGAPSGTHPSGSLWMRSDGAVGSRLYVSQGGGTWTPVAGV
jgi:hypothetical protein